MKSISVTLPMITPSQVIAVESELGRKKIDFSVVHDKAKRSSRYIITVRSDSEIKSLPKLVRTKIGVS